MTEHTIPLSFCMDKDQAMAAVLSPCGRYRLRLDRTVDTQFQTVAALIGVNPSTADATVDDPTIRRDIGFARRHSWRKIIKANKFAYRATDVRALRQADDPVGPGCDTHLRQVFQEADILIACWGPMSKLPRHLRERWRDVVAMADEAGKQLKCFGTAKDGHPRHTLMLPYSAKLVEWHPPA